MNRLKKLFAKLVYTFLLTSILLVLLFKWLPVPTSAFMLANKINNLSQPINYQWVAYEKMSKHLPLAALAAEDQKFFHHYGLDFKAILQAYQHNKKSNKRSYGASTITQQTAKNLFLWPDKSYIRKVIELYFSALIELLWSKQRIIEVYLNIAQFGEFTYGVAAASELYLKQKPQQVSAYNAARLMALLPNPASKRFYQPGYQTQKKVQHIRKQMRQLGGVKFVEEGLK